jgi:cyclophilin family peptidyl-prolyl cis-trans isomerase
MMLKKLTALSAGLMVSLATWAAPTVEITTSLGAITLELYPEKAPRTVEMFLYNAKHGFYESTIFHRVIDGFMIQGGGFNQSMTEKKVLTPALKSEATTG